MIYADYIPAVKKEVGDVLITELLRADDTTLQLALVGQLEEAITYAQDAYDVSKPEWERNLAAHMAAKDVFKSVVQYYS